MEMSPRFYICNQNQNVEQAPLESVLRIMRVDVEKSSRWFGGANHSPRDLQGEAFLGSKTIIHEELLDIFWTLIIPHKIHKTNQLGMDHGPFTFFPIVSMFIDFHDERHLNPAECLKKLMKFI